MGAGPTFLLKEGVQCEKCHGAGSEYADAAIMVDRQAAMRAGLNIPTKEDCVNCHFEKGSHRIVLGPRVFDVDEAWQTHRSPHARRAAAANTRSRRSWPSRITPAAKYLGAAGCAQCHTGAQMGFQFSKWRASKHAQAYATLSTPRAREIAAQWQLTGDPRTIAECLKCHATAYHDPAGGVEETYSVQEGVSCEACHGAGSHYATEPVMKDRAAAEAAGLKPTTPETCRGVPCQCPRQAL